MTTATTSYNDGERNSEALLDSRSLRDRYAEKVEALERVGKLVLLPDDLHVTTEMAANFYKVAADNIRMLLAAYQDEFELDGKKVLTGFELSKLKLLSPMINKHTRQLTLLPRRAVLRIGMLLRDSEVAKVLRSYLLNVEEIAREKAPEIIGDAYESTIKAENLPMDYEESLVQLLEQVRANKRLTAEVKAVKAEVATVKAENAIMAPKAKRFDRFLNADSLMRVEDVAKAFGIKGMGRNNLFKYLREKGFLVKSRHGGRSLPIQRYLDMGLFDIIWKNYEKFDHITGTIIFMEVPMTYVTAKGVDYIYNLMVKDGLIAA